MRLGTILVFALCLFSGPSRGADSIWGDWRAGGNGCQSGVEVIRNGNALAILFSQFQIDMPAGMEILTDHRHCIFSIDVLPPEGFMLAAIKQVFTGGIIKSKGAAAQMTLAYKVGPIKKEQEIRWPGPQSISPDSPDSLFTRSFMDPLPTTMCRQRHNYNIRVDFRAGRKDRKDFLMGGLDSVDTEGLPNINLIPEWQACNPRPPRPR